MMDDDEVFAAFLLLTTAAMLYLKRKKRVRRYKVRPINRNRIVHGQFHKRVRRMREMDHEQYFKYTRMTPAVFDNLLSIVGPHLQRHKKKSHISPAERLTLTLHYLAEGCSMQEIATNFYMGKTTVHIIIKQTCSVLWDVLSPIHLKPPTGTEFVKISKGFYQRWNMPNCLGALDGKHIQIQAPAHSGSDFFNYKKTSR
uniref:DDE Tnp4 domain-containing protein n=1 Tax=Photinus pyralis TaxID=7054 RepID=A0A1Y1MU88_PHOPY